MNKAHHVYPRACRDLTYNEKKQELKQHDGTWTKVPNKRFSVQNAHTSVRQTLQDFNIPCVKRTFGPGVVRVICRNFVQLDNIAMIIEDLLRLRLIEEIGMPLDYSHKFVNLVLFLKPMDVKSSMKLERVFKTCTLQYNFRVLHIKYPPDAAKEYIITEKSNSTKRIASMDNISKIIIFVTIIIIFLTNALFGI